MLTTILLRTVRKVSKYVVMMGSQRESGVTTTILQCWDVHCARDAYFVRRRDCFDLPSCIDFGNEPCLSFEHVHPLVRTIIILCLLCLEDEIIFTDLIRSLWGIEETLILPIISEMA